MDQNIPRHFSIARQVVLRLCRSIEWISEEHAWIQCPGEHDHTTETKRGHCAVHLDGVPTIYCFHTSCREKVALTNSQLRREIGRFGRLSIPHRNGGRARPASSRRPTKSQLQEAGRASLAVIFERYPWTYAQILKDSPASIDHGTPSGHWKHLLGLFSPEDVLWIGDKFDSRKDNPCFSRFFLPAKNWLYCHRAPGPFTCPSTFFSGSWSRSNDRVAVRRFLVIESDTLEKDQIGSIFQWLVQDQGLTLKAIVDTAGKSLHGWFLFPDAERLKKLQQILPYLECDPALFRRAQPVRLPGFKRADKFQRLVYLQK
jgi:hypothetical protein